MTVKKSATTKAPKASATKTKGTGVEEDTLTTKPAKAAKAPKEAKAAKDAVTDTAPAKGARGRKSTKSDAKAAKPEVVEEDFSDLEADLEGEPEV